MRNFKKVISLVLVFAMLASFAGMTGFTAQAAARETFVTKNGVIVDMPLTVYAKQYNEANVISDYSSVAGDYLVTEDYNKEKGVDLAWYINFPDGAEKVNVWMSDTGNDGDWTYLWGSSTEDYVAPSAIAGGRSAYMAQNNDYGKFYGRQLKGNGGFRNVGTVYVKATFTLNGVPYDGSEDAWEIKVVRDNTPTSFTNSNGYTINMTPVVYKTVAEGTETGGYQSSTAVKGDYIIHTDENNLAYSVTFPSGHNMKYFYATVSLDGGASWSNPWWGNVSVADQASSGTFSRSTNASAYQHEYSFFIKGMNNMPALEGNGGYLNVDKIMWRFYVTAEEKVNYNLVAEWSVDVEFYGDEEKPNTGNSVVDSKAGINTATIDMPTILYTSGGKIVKSALGNSNLNTILKIDVPDDTKSATIKAVSIDTDAVVYKTWTYSAPDSIALDFSSDENNDANTLTGGNVWLCLRLDYVVTVDNTPYNTPTGSTIDSTFEQAQQIGQSAYFDDTFEEICLPDTIDVTYTQYISCYVKAVPTYYRAGWQAYFRSRYNNAMTISLLEYMDFSSLFGIAGTDFSTSFRTNTVESVISSSTVAKTNMNTVSNGLFNYKEGKRESGTDTAYGSNGNHFVGGNWGNNGTNSQRTMGASIYFDAKVAASKTVTFKMIYDFGDHSGGVNYRDGSTKNLDTFKMHWADTSRVGYNYTTPSTYEGLGGTPATYNANTLDNANGASTTGITASGTYPNGNFEWESANFEQTYSVEFSKFSSTKYLRLYHYIQTKKSSGLMNTDIRGTLGWHIDIVRVDRSKAYDIIAGAKAKNYVQAEMDADWWATYRRQVLFAYFSIGDLGNLSGGGDWCYSEIANYADGNGNWTYGNSPKYATANFTLLLKNINNTPAYDRGGYITDENNGTYNVTKVKPGSKYETVIKYRGEHAADPSDNKYATSDFIGDGLSNMVVDNNNPNSLKSYRYSGAYFYTEDSWRAYATQRRYATNIAKYKYKSGDNVAAPYETWWYAAAGLSSPAPSEVVLLDCYYQDTVDAAVERLANAYNALELKTLAEFRMRDDRDPLTDYTGDGKEDQVTAGGGKWVYFDKDIKDANGNVIYKSGEQVKGYDAIMAYLRNLIPTETVTYYTEIADNNDNGKIDALDLDGDGYIDDLNPVTAPVYNTGDLEALLSTMQNMYYADDTVVSMGLGFEAAIENFLAQVEITKRSPAKTDSSIWSEIFDKVRNNLGNSKMEIGDLVGVIKNEYNLTDSDTAIININSAISQYAGFNLESNADVGQETFNTIAETFFTALNSEATAKKIDVAATEALKATEGKFTVYNPYNLAAFGKEGKEHALYEWNAKTTLNENGQTEAVKDGLAYVGKYTQDSIDDLDDAVTAAKAKGYNILTTSVANDIVADADKLLAQAGVKTITGVTPILVGAKADFTVLKTTLDEAEEIIAGSSFTVSYNGKTAPHNKYTAHSIAELIAVVNLAKDYISANATQAEDGSYVGNNDYTTQLNVDKLVFQIQDEMYNDRRLVNIAPYDSVEDPNTGMSTDVAKYHFAWAYTDPDINGVVIATPTANDLDFYNTQKWSDMLTREIKFTGHDNGLVDNTAYYGFLEEELTTPYLTEDGLRVDEDYSIWDEDGWAVLGADGKVPTNTIFDQKWGQYQTAYDNAYEAYKNQTYSATEEGQAAVDELARILAEKRAQLAPASFDFSKDQNYGAAQKLYEELSAYVLKTDITRYGYVDAFDENGKKIGIDESDNPSDFAKESVYIYDGVTATIETKITDFYGKYASPTPSAQVGEYDKAVELYNEIKTLIETNNITIKTTDHADFYKGMNDLITNYVAGDWNGTEYTSDILSGTQAAEFQNRFAAAQGYISASTNATADFGGDLGAATNQVFNYAMNTRAKDMKFATAMKDQVENFMGLQYDVGAVDFYNNGEAIGKQYVFKQSTADDYKDEIATFFGDDNKWPLIYQVNNLVVAQDATTEIYSVTTYPSGGATAVAGNKVDEQIDAIMNKLAYSGEGSYYTKILGETNAYYTDALKWIYQNATYEYNGSVYVLADLQPNTDNASATTSAAGEEINYDVLKPKTGGGYWYSEGYGTKTNNRVYYLLNDPTPEDGEASTWFSNYTTVDGWVETQVKGTSFGNSFGITENGNNNTVTWASILNSKLESFPLIATHKRTVSGNLVMQQKTYNSYYYATQITSNGWTKARQESFIGKVNYEQGVIDSAANTYYDNIQQLALLSALDAYRDVATLYEWSQRRSVTSWGENNYNANATSTATSTIFFNDNLETFLKKIGENNYTGPHTDTEKYGAYDYYLANDGYVISYDEKSAEWTALSNFITDFYEEKADGTMLTIDMADLVNKVDASDGITSKKETLIGLIKALPLTRLNFDDLDSLVSAFFENGNSAIAMNSLAGTQYADTYGLAYPSVPQATTQFYKSDNYTTASLKAVADLLLQNGVIKQTLYAQAAGNGFVTNIDFNSENTDHAGSFYTSPKYGDKTEQAAITAVTEALAQAISSLVLERAVTDHDKDNTKEVNSIDDQIAIALDIVNNLQDMYETDSNEWARYLKLLYGEGGSIENPAEGSALYIQAKCNTEEGYYTKALHQLSVVDKIAIDMASIVLPKKADKTAPKVTLSIDVNDVKNFYASDIKDGDMTNSQLIAEKDSVSYDAQGNAAPATGTFFMPGSGNDTYSILVYTNELNPRLLLEVKDSSNGKIESTKNEFIDIYAKRTAGTDTNLIYGTMSKNNQIVEISTADVAEKDNEGNYLFTGYENKYDKPAKYEGDTAYSDEESSVFAILAPTFAENTSVQMAQYFITVRDSAGGSGGTDNYAVTLDMGEGDLKEMYTADNTISIYVYYNNAMPASGDEGINQDGTKADGPEEMATVMLSGEPGFDGTTWRNGVTLRRSFTSLHRVWEYVAPVKNSSDMQGIPVYNDPTFGRLNTGSFYYVIKRTAAEDATAEQKAVNDLILDAYGGKSETGKMDYAKATQAKELLIDYINGKKKLEVDGKTVDVFGTMQASKSNFYPYGDYERDETTGEILYYDGDRAGEPKWINWAQVIGGKVDNGDLVFVHVVDRWGNVVNRIIEITKLDKKKPVIQATTGEVTITETGGSGIANIQIWNGMHFEEVSNAADYEIFANRTQKTETGEDGKLTVSSSNNVFTVSGLGKGARYYLDIYDKAGSISQKTVIASSDGTLSFEIIDVENNIGTQNDLESGEENVVPQSVSFTLNGTDTVVLNAGKESSVINAEINGNVPADRIMIHYVTTRDNVTQLKMVDEAGKVEEWIAADEEIVDNGDGTLTWALYRKMTEGEHSYKVYAMVDGAYENFYATATVTATTRYVTLTYVANGMGAVSLQYSGTEVMTPNTYQSITVPYGAEVTLFSKVNTQGCDFYYWVNRNTDRIISTADNYSFRAVTDGNIAAQFTSRATFRDGEKLVVYVNNAKNVVKSFQLAEGEDYTVPTGPILPDYAFRGWSMSKEEILASTESTIVVEPVYVLKAENTVTITQGNYTATGDGTYVAEENQRAVVTISASATDNDGNAFLYWIDEDTDEIVTYDRTYTFFCVKDTVLTPVYGDISGRKVAPVVRITKVSYSALSGKVSFFAERSVPEEFTVLQTGIVVTRTEAIGTNEEVFVVGGASTNHGESTSTENNGYYSANASISTGQTVWARAYVIYETADGEILEAYGPVASYSVD